MSAQAQHSRFRQWLAVGTGTVGVLLILAWATWSVVAIWIISTRITLIPVLLTALLFVFYVCGIHFVRDWVKPRLRKLKNGSN